MQSDDTFYLLKIIIVGDTQVGKSSLITRFFDKRFGAIVSTVGVDFRIMKNIKLKTGKLYQISIWDTAGQEQFKSIVKFSCKGSDGAIICFDLSDASSLKSVHEWAKYVRLHCPEHLSIVLVGTKMDLPAQVTPEDIQQALNLLQIDGREVKYQRFINIGYFQTSSKTQEGVEEMFHHTFEICAQGKEIIEVDVPYEDMDRTQSRGSKKSLKLSSFKGTVTQSQSENKKQNESQGCC